MEPRKRTHLVNELMQEAHLMMGALEKAMEGERIRGESPRQARDAASPGTVQLGG